MNPKDFRKGVITQLGIIDPEIFGKEHKFYLPLFEKREGVTGLRTIFIDDKPLLILSEEEIETFKKENKLEKALEIAITIQLKKVELKMLSDSSLLGVEITTRIPDEYKDHMEYYPEGAK